VPVVPHIPKHCGKIGMTVNSEMYLGRLTVSVRFGSVAVILTQTSRLAGVGQKRPYLWSIEAA